MLGVMQGNVSLSVTMVEQPLVTTSADRFTCLGKRFAQESKLLVLDSKTCELMMPGAPFKIQPEV